MEWIERQTFALNVVACTVDIVPHFDLLVNIYTYIYIYIYIYIYYLMLQIQLRARHNSSTDMAQSLSCCSIICTTFFDSVTIISGSVFYYLHLNLDNIDFSHCLHLNHITNPSLHLMYQALNRLPPGNGNLCSCL